MTQLIKYNERPLFEGLSRLENMFSSDWAALDVQENEDRVDVIVDLPGVHKENVEISYENDILDIKAFRSKEESSGKRSERSWGEIRRTISIPGIKTDEATASLEDGVLRICLPTESHPEGKKIEIE